MDSNQIQNCQEISEGFISQSWYFRVVFVQFDQAYK